MEHIRGGKVANSSFGGGPINASGVQDGRETILDLLLANGYPPASVTRVGGRKLLYFACPKSRVSHHQGLSVRDTVLQSVCREAGAD